jgi:hypothetical protein|tara:strand:+ start:994 stop:1392 length:399 start_codon:yes stop_codon:yes gene_type:complete
MIAKDSKIKMGSNRSFGLVFFIVFLIIGLWPLKVEGSINLWLIAISLIFLFLGLMNSKVLSPLNKLWFKFGIILGAIIAPIVMCIIYFLVVTPIGLIMKIMGKDLLNLKYNKSAKTYWIKRNIPVGTMKRQF